MPTSKNTPTLRDWLAQDAFGLAMSSGFFGFFAHCGMLSALEDAGLRPTRVSGSSAGALIAALWAAGMDSARIRDGLFELERGSFWDPGLGPGLLRGQKFRDLLTELLPVSDFEACRVPLAVSVHEIRSRRTRVVRNGPLVPAVYASCCVPLMFQPIRMNGRRVVDGGVSDRPGLAGMPAGRVFYHHLSSRSPWRRKTGAHTHIPSQPDMQTLVIDDLPRSGPKRLEAGRLAYAQARTTTQKALALPLDGPVMRLDAK